VSDLRASADKLPRHVAIIMDGNGRWAKKNKLQIAFGHRSGVNTLRGIVRESSNIGIHSLSVFAFSTENWTRPDEEVRALMLLIEEFFNSQIDELHRENVIIRILGDRNNLPDGPRKAAERAELRTRDNTGLHLNIALNYGGRADILHAAALISCSVQKGDLSLSEITEDLFSDFLSTRGLPDVDLLIRTGGEMRLSNFLLYQSAYAEFVFTDALWPEFTVEDYRNALGRFMNRDRRFGRRDQSGRDSEGRKNA